MSVFFCVALAITGGSNALAQSTDACIDSDGDGWGWDGSIREASGLEPWLDAVDIQTGLIWDDSIREAVDKCRFFMACISEVSVSKSGYIQKEFRWAVDRLQEMRPGQVYLITALLDDVEIPNIQVGTRNLRDVQAIRLFNFGGLRKLKEHIERLLEVEEPSKIPKQSTTIRLLSEIQADIQRNSTGQALRKLLEFAQLYDIDSVNSIIMLNGRYHRYKEHEINGVVNSNDINIMKNRLNQAILSTIENIKDKLNI